MKIQILGFSGSGKSTLAETLSERLSLPVIYLDTVFWLPGWQMRPREEQTEILTRFLDEHEGGWVIDGNYTKNCYDRRMQEADRILFLNFNRFLCLWRILKRNHMYQGKSRASMTVGCDEKIDWEFIKWSFWDSRTKKSLAKYQLLRETYGDKFIELKNPKMVNAFLETMPLRKPIGKEDHHGVVRESHSDRILKMI